MAFQGDSIYWVETEKVVPNPFQPRREFNEHKLKELSESIRMYGVLQPLTVTRQEIQRDDGTFYTEYELIAGERRLRASKLAGVAQVPVIIREGEDSEQEKLELAIIENLQREDLNAVDRALAFKQLAEQFGLSHVQVAQKVGRSREYVSNSIRLLGLPENILEGLKRGEISEGHARTLLMLNDRPEEQQVVFEEAKIKKLSVRDVERIARKIATEKVRKKNDADFDIELIEMEKQFTEALGTRVQIQKTEFGGRVAIDYFTTEDLEEILKRMNAEAAAGDTAEESARQALAKLASHTPLVTDTEEEKVLVEDDPVQEEETAAVADVKSDTKDDSATAPDSEAATEPTYSESEQSNSQEAATVTPEEKEVGTMRSILANLTANLHHKESAPVSETPSISAVVDAASDHKRDMPVAENSDSYITPSAVVNEKSVDEKEVTKEDDDDSDLYAINRFTV